MKFCNSKNRLRRCKLINRLRRTVLCRYLSFPLKSLLIDKFLFIWIVTTFVGGLFTLFADFLLGKEHAVVDTLKTGNVYLFSITLLIPTVADCLLFFPAEEGNREYNAKIQQDPSVKESLEELIPLLKIKSITRHVVVILALSLLVIFISLFLYLGEYKEKVSFQIISAFFSVYISFYYYCLNRVSQYKHNYEEDYLDDERKSMLSLTEESHSESYGPIDNISNVNLEPLIRKESLELDRASVASDSNTETKTWAETMEDLDKLVAEKGANQDNEE